MATKIGFDPSLATPGVDWSVVTTSVIDGLNALEERREKAQKNVDTKTREEVDVLRNVEMGKDAQVNEFVMNAREQLTETALLDKRLWENGILSTKDFLRNNNNRTTGTASLINSFKTYNADYDRIVKGVEDKTLSRITLNRKAQVEKLFDMRTHAFVVNPTTGEPNIVKRDANGAPSSDPNDIVNSSVVDFLSTADVKYFNAQTTAQAIVDSLGQRLKRDGLGKTIKGAYLALDSAGDAAQTKLNEARDEAIDVALMGSNMASFLVDSGDYDTTTNKDEAAKNDKLILENPDGTFEYTDEQKKEAKARFDNLLESMIPRSEEAALPKTPSDTELRRKGQIQSLITNMSKLWYGNQKEIEAAIRSLISSAPKQNIVGIDVQDNEVVIEKIDKDGTITQKGKGARYKTSYPREDFDLFIESISSELGGAVNSAEAIRIARNSLPKGRQEKGEKGVFNIPKQRTLTENFSDYITQYFTEIIPLSKDEEEAESQVRAFLLPFGDFTIEQTAPGRDRLEISFGEGRNKIQTTVDLSTEQALEELKSFLVNNLSFFQEGVRLQEDEMINKLAGSQGGGQGQSVQTITGGKAR
jgi:hypothetical protein